MIKLRNIFELIRYAWKTKHKVYLVIYGANVVQMDNYKEAHQKAIEVIKKGDDISVKIALELAVIDTIKTINK